MAGVVTPADARAKIAEQVAAENIGEPANLEEQALSLVGRDIFETLVKGYTEKQWGRDCRDLPASIIKRLPCRFTYDNNYFNDRYQGIPMGGYTKMVASMLEGIEVRCGVEYKELAAAEPDIAARTIYCGPIDAFYDLSWARSSTAACASRPRRSTRPTTRAWPWSTTPSASPLHAHHRAQAL